MAAMASRITETQLSTQQLSKLVQANFKESIKSLYYLPFAMVIDGWAVDFYTKGQ